MDVKELERALEERDSETIKKLAAIDAKADKAATDTREVKDILTDIEQKMAQRSMGTREGFQKSAGRQLTDSTSFKTFDGRSAGSRARVEIKATLTTLTTDAAGSVGALGTPFGDEGVTLPQRTVRIRDLIPTIAIGSGSVDVMIQKLGTRAAAMVAEGAQKPYSDLQYEKKTFVAKVIAHLLKESKQVAEDLPQLAGLIDTELLYGLALKEDQQLLSGDGTGENLHGMIPQATAFEAPISMVADTMIDTIGLAILQGAIALYPPDGVVVNPADWWGIRLTKDDEGRYIYGPPSVAVTPTIFGVPVVATPAMAIDKFLVGQFRLAATIYDRWDAAVEVATMNVDDFEKNLLTVRCEERLAFAVKRPAALIYGDFGNV